MLISSYLGGRCLEENMQGKRVGAIAVSSIALAVRLGAAWHATAQNAKALYPSMAPLDQYLMEDWGF